RTTGDNARTRSSRAQQHLASTETTDAVVRDRGTQHRNLEQVLASLITALADGLWHLVGLAHADPDVPGFVADDHQGREAEPSPALHDLGDAVDVNHPFFQAIFIEIFKCCH